MEARRLGVSRALVDGTWVAGDVTVSDGRVSAVGVEPSGRRGCAVPGFVDLQVNGFGGVDFATADAEGFASAADAMALHGVTAFAPTIPTADPAAYPGILRTAVAATGRRTASPRMIGLHLEGPFLSPERAGAHRVDWLRPPDVDVAMSWCDRAPVSIMTVAPELDGAAELIAALRARGVIASAGHTMATAADAHAAFDAGCSMVTHLWNAQPPFTSRAPGLVGTALSRSDVHVGVIADLVHIAPETLRVTLAAAGRRAFVVTDDVAEAGRPAGTYVRGGRELASDATVARLPDGTIAGSVLPIDAALRNLVSVGLPLDRAVAALTESPACAVGRPELGRLGVGLRADVVVLGDDLAVDDVLIGGVSCRP